MVFKKNTLRYKLLQVMAFLGDAGIELLMNEILVSGKVRMPNRKKYSSRYFESLLKEFTSTGYIERVSKGGIEHLKLSSRANSKIAKYIPLPYLQKIKWDGYFRGAPYDFPEKLKYKRDTLRKQFKDWGMGQYQLSLWITPHPIEEAIDDFLEAQNLNKFALRFMSKKLTPEEGQKVAEEVWGVSKIAKAYDKFCLKWGIKLRDDKIKPTDREALRYEYFSILERDPHLPFELLQDEWLAKEAKEAYFAIEAHIRKHFK